LEFIFIYSSYTPLIHRASNLNRLVIKLQSLHKPTLFI